MIMNINWKLSEDIVKVIFSKLRFSDLPNCRIVCKAWNHVVSDYAKSDMNPNAFLVYTVDVTIQPFTCVQLQHLNPKMSCIDFEKTTSVATLTFDRHCNSAKIYASCNGLLHITKQMSSDIWCDGIWNPMTNEFFKFQRSRRGYDISCYGFGFSPKTKQYKLFKITFFRTIQVWRFGISNQWEDLGRQPFVFLDNGIYLNGVIYWYGLVDDFKNEFVIHTIDVETETFETDAIVDIGPYLGLKLHPFNSTICLIVFCAHRLELWIMRAKHSWIREFVFDVHLGLKGFYHNIVFEDEGDIYFMVGNGLYCFDKKGKRIKVKTLFNPNEKVIKRAVQLEAFHFGSLQQILAGND